MARYLSADWFSELAARSTAASAGADEAGRRGDVDAVLEQVVEGTPGGAVVYRVEIAGSQARVVWPVPPDAPDPDLRVTCSWPTAVALATGELSSQQALDGGLLRVKGSLARVAEVSSDLAGLDAVPAEVRAATSY